MRDGGTTHGAMLVSRRGGIAHVTLRGRVGGPVRVVRTVEGWEAAALDVGGVLAICTGAGAADRVPVLRVDDEVAVIGLLRARRGGRPEDDAVELEATLIAVRQEPGAPRRRRPRRPRIGA